MSAVDPGAHLGGLQEQMRRLAPAGGHAFVAACAERLWPAYPLFAAREGWGDEAELRRGLDALWELAGGGELDADELRALSESCLELTPHTDDFDSELAQMASDAGAAIVTGLEGALKWDPDQAASAGSLVLDALDAYVSVVEGDPPDDVLAAHPLIAGERERQVTELERIAKGSDPATIADTLRRDARDAAYADVARELASQ